VQASKLLPLALTVALAGAGFGLGRALWGRADAAALPASTWTGLGLVFWCLVDLMDTSQALLAEIAPRLADFTDPGAQA
jgi:hypothetical protein